MAFTLFQRNHFVTSLVILILIKGNDKFTDSRLDHGRNGQKCCKFLDQLNIIARSQKYSVQDGKVTEEEFARAFMKEEKFSTIIIQKLMNRYIISKHNILAKSDK